MLARNIGVVERQILIVCGLLFALAGCGQNGGGLDENSIGETDISIASVDRELIGGSTSTLIVVSEQQFSSAEFSYSFEQISSDASELSSAVSTSLLEDNSNSIVVTLDVPEKPGTYLLSVEHLGETVFQNIVNVTGYEIAYLTSEEEFDELFIQRPGNGSGVLFGAEQFAENDSFSIVDNGLMFSASTMNVVSARSVPSGTTSSLKEEIPDVGLLDCKQVLTQDEIDRKLDFWFREGQLDDPTYKVIFDMCASTAFNFKSRQDSPFKLTDIHARITSAFDEQDKTNPDQTKIPAQIPHAKLGYGVLSGLYDAVFNRGTNTKRKNSYGRLSEEEALDYTSLLSGKDHFNVRFGFKLKGSHEDKRWREVLNSHVYAFEDNGRCIGVVYNGTSINTSKGEAISSRIPMPGDDGLLRRDKTNLTDDHIDEFTLFRSLIEIDLGEADNCDKKRSVLATSIYQLMSFHFLNVQQTFENAIQILQIANYSFQLGELAVEKIEYLGAALVAAAAYHPVRKGGYYVLASIGVVGAASAPVYSGSSIDDAINVSQCLLEGDSTFCESISTTSELPDNDTILVIGDRASVVSDDEISVVSEYLGYFDGTSGVDDVGLEADLDDEMIQVELNSGLGILHTLNVDAGNFKISQRLRDEYQAHYRFIPNRTPDEAFSLSLYHSNPDTRTSVERTYQLVDVDGVIMNEGAYSDWSCSACIDSFQVCARECFPANGIVNAQTHCPLPTEVGLDCEVSPPSCEAEAWTPFGTCVNNSKSRSRSYFPEGCRSPDVEYMFCTNSEWGDWSQWSACVDGQRRRTRECTAGTETTGCEGDSVEIEACSDISVNRIKPRSSRVTISEGDSLELGFNCSASGTEIDYIRWLVNGRSKEKQSCRSSSCESEFDGRYEFSDDDPGDYTITGRCVAGQLESELEWDVEVEEEEQVNYPPIILSVYPDNNATVRSGFKVRVQADDADDGVKRISASIRDEQNLVVSFFSITSSNSLSWGPKLDPGNYSLKIIVSDRSGETKQQTVSFRFR